MNLFAPKANVQAPARQPLPYGLFSVFQPQSSAERWLAGGVSWEALDCSAAVGLPVDAALDDPVHEFDDDGPQFGSARPFSIVSRFSDSLAVANEAEAQARAEEHLLLNEQRRVEQALWTGDLQNYPNLAGLNNPEGYSAPQSLGSADLIGAVALLEAFLGDSLGFAGVIHVPRHIASRLASNGFIEARGGRMLTKLDTPVVIGSGYSGDRMRVSPPLFGYRNDPETWSLPDIRQNNRVAVAIRDYVIGFDPCGTAEVEVTLDETP